MLRLAARLLHHRHLVVAGAALAVVLTNLVVSGAPDDWWYFQEAARVLAGRDPQVHPWEFYAAHPGTWIGPLPLLVATPLGLLPDAVGGCAVAVLSGLALGVLTRTAERCAQLLGAPAGASRVAVLVGGCLATPVWTEFCTTYTHPEDVAVVLLGALALQALLEGRAGACGVALGLAAGGKPWAVGLLVLVLALPTRRGRLRAALAGALAAGLPWLPFALVPGALSAVGSSTARVFGGTPLGVAGWADEVYPTTARLTQFTFALVLVLAVGVLRRRPEAALFACVAARLLLEPQVLHYHWASLAGAAVLVDAAARRRAPVLSLLVAAAYQGSRTVGEEWALAAAQVVPFAAVLVLLLAPGPAGAPAPTVAVVPHPRTGRVAGRRARLSRR
ncbi:hypothetical protein [Kineococcus gypseus]|uniref:hypothetical protein n=1 Tax=Kineococcus gypseus TaxID=1637102 RepID=UPI003D7E4D24